MLDLHGVRLGHCWAASGVRNFDDRGYPYHKRFPWNLANFDGSVFVTKTVTIDEIKGNMPLEIDGFTPIERRPECIYVDIWSGNVANAVGLTNRGAEFYLWNACWLERREPFVISFMAVGSEERDVLDQTVRFVDLMEKQIPRFKTRFALQVNLSCPNVEHGKGDKLNEIWTVLTKLQDLGVPLVPKFNALTPVTNVVQISRHPGVAAVSISNTIPWKDLSDKVRKSVFGETESPLEKFGGGGWSGKNAFAFTRNWFESARTEKFNVPVLGGCGVNCWARAKELIDLGASGIEFGSIVITNPWDVPSLIRKVNNHFAKKEA